RFSRDWSSDVCSSDLANLWEQNPKRHDDACWSWRKGFGSYAKYHPKRFELAIWFAKAQLCGLSLGKPTYSGSRLRLDFIEGAPRSEERRVGKECRSRW